MPIRARKNLYNGINAHLHSHLQHESGGWEVFHASHIIDLGRAIDALLPPGYLVDPEKGLQIRAFDTHTGNPITVSPRRPRPDVTIYRTNEPIAKTTASAMPASVPTLVAPAIDALPPDDDLYLTALVIYQVVMDGERKPVTWLELLSPTNKPFEDGFWQYSAKRAATLKAGVSLVEIDYIHETRSPVLWLPVYPQDAEAAPYRVIVTDPHPNLEDGRMTLHAFHVDEPIPVIFVPLLDGDGFVLDLHSVYNQTFESFASFGARVDYEHLPQKFEAYNATDQQRIQARIKNVQESHRKNQV
ncbi:MAG: DUF4058 family protein [Anaerolineae bacterium]